MNLNEKFKKTAHFKPRKAFKIGHLLEKFKKICKTFDKINKFMYNAAQRPKGRNFKGVKMQVNSVSANAATAASQLSTKSTDEKSAKNANIQSALSSSKLDSETIEKLRSLGGNGITNYYIAQFQQESLSVSFGNFGSQSSVLDLLTSDSSKATSILSQIDFASIGYTGKNILAMNSDELNELVSEDGFFGIENTASRIADFVINGAGDDLEKLQKGFEGMKQGFEQAEKIWGDKLPQISQDTIDKAIAKVSARIDELGGNAVNLQA